MSREYPRRVRDAKVKCIPCNAPSVELASGEYVCVECGKSPIQKLNPEKVLVERDGVRVEKSVDPTAGGVIEIQLSIESRSRMPVAVRIAETVPEPLRASIALESGSEQDDWYRNDAGVEYNAVLDPRETVRRSYSLENGTGVSGIKSKEPTIQAVNPIDSETASKIEVPTWRGQGSATATPSEPPSNPNGANQAVLTANAAGVEQGARSESSPAFPQVHGDDSTHDGFIESPDDSIPESGAENVRSYLLPPDSSEQPVISVVLPTKNEEAGIKECIDAVISALETLELPGEVIVSDSSTDRTPDIARSYGAKVVSPDRDGYGAAYQYGFAHARGEFIVMGDADTTYDFEELPKLFERVVSGDVDLVMGSRFKGEIKPGAMPWLHRKIGNPVLTKFLNTFYDANVSDAHSGFRVISREALDELELRSDGMEFASEMVMSAGERGLTIAEEPITYHERVGEAKLDSLSDGWRHVKFMLTNTPTHLFSLPAVGLTLLGLTMMLLSVLDARVFGLTFATHAVIAGSLLTIIGYQIASLAVFSAVAGTAIKQSDPITSVIRDQFQLEHGATLGLVLYAIGAVYVAAMVVRWVSSGYSSLPFVAWNMVAFTCIVLGAQTVFYSFFLSQLGQGFHEE